jgi:phosphoribosylglycinamide formyltransferase-1
MTSGKIKLGVLVSGRGTNLQAIIDSIEQNKLNAEIILVLSNVQSAPALERSKQHGIDSTFVDAKSFARKAEFDQELVDRLKAKEVDLVCLAGYMKILSENFISAFAGKIINIHPSLLPAFPGLHPQRQALECGAKISGCTVHFVDTGVDTGPIILQSAVPVLADDDEDSLAARILLKEHELYPEAIRLIQENRLTLKGRKVIRH